VLVFDEVLRKLTASYSQALCEYVVSKNVGILSDICVCVCVCGGGGGVFHTHLFSRNPISPIRCLHKAVLSKARW
jgi:hypothetical protein